VTSSTTGREALHAVTREDVGMGTPYERYSIHNFLRYLCEEYVIETAFEGPTDGMTGIRGINSMALAGAGVEVTLMLPEEQIPYAQKAWTYEGLENKVRFAPFVSEHFADDMGGFDLVWNFNSIPQMQDTSVVMSQMARISKRFVLVFVGNKSNYGYYIHRLHHKKTGTPWEHGDVEAMNISRIEEQFSALGFRTVQKLLADVPFWPDIDTTLEEVIGDLLPILKPLLSGRKSTEQRLRRFRFDYRSLPYFSEERLRDFRRLMGKYDFIEYSRLPIPKFLFAHHRGILLEKRD
jgi:hypothetical protein